MDKTDIMELMEAMEAVQQETVQQNTTSSTQHPGMIAAYIFGVVFFVAVLGFILAMAFSPKARAKMMGKQIKAVKYTVDENEEAIRSITTKTANATKEGVETTVRAIRKGIKEDK